MSHVRALDPRALPDESEHLADRLEDIEDATIGFLWNNRPRGDRILRGLADRLESRYGTSTVFTNKLRVGSGAPQEEIRKLEKETEAVIVGVGD